MKNKESWDFRDRKELDASHEYNKVGYIIEKADTQYLKLIKDDIEKAYVSLQRRRAHTNLEMHLSVADENSNDLRLHIMEKIFQSTRFHKNYYNTAKDVIHSLCGNELAMQRRPGLSINLPNNRSDVLPIHADTWNGVSPYELNIWIPLVNCTNSMCLYILKRDSYEHRLKESKELLR